MATQDQQAQPAAPDDRLASSPEGEFDERRAKMERLRAEGIDPYPPVTLWGTRTRIADVLAAHDPAQLDAGEHPELAYEIAGRLVPGVDTARPRSWISATCRARSRRLCAWTRSARRPTTAS